MYLAEEAIGLVKSLEWNISKGPSFLETSNDMNDEEDSSDGEEIDKENRDRLKLELGNDDLEDQLQ